MTLGTQRKSLKQMLEMQAKTDAETDAGGIREEFARTMHGLRGPSQKIYHDEYVKLIARIEHATWRATVHC